MAANPTPRPQEVKPQWEEVKSPEQFQFTKQGQMIEGWLLSIEPVVIKGKEAIEYMFQSVDGGRITCLGMVDLNKKITPNHIGMRLQVRYERDDSSFQKAGQNAMKIFKVLADKNSRPAA